MSLRVTCLYDNGSDGRAALDEGSTLRPLGSERRMVFSDFCCCTIEDRHC